MEPIDSFENEFRFLSNFYPSVVTYEGESYSSVEHAFQAAKTTNLEERKRIRESSNPGEAKKLGRQATMTSDWNDRRLSVMEDLLRQKFSHPSFASKLKATAGRELIEGNWWNDTFWGVCKGVGENNLGKLLMKIRDEL